MRFTDTGRQPEVLLVDDNEDDALITRKGFEMAKFSVNLHHVENGKECMAFLHKAGKHVNVPTPDLILLDLNLPEMDGREVLTQIVTDGELRRLPVVILTTSDAKRDLLDMYNLRCSSYITKPVDFNRFLSVIEDLGNYWFDIVDLPPKG